MKKEEEENNFKPEEDTRLIGYLWLLEFAFYFYGLVFVIPGLFVSFIWVLQLISYPTYAFGAAFSMLPL